MENRKLANICAFSAILKIFKTYFSKSRAEIQLKLPLVIQLLKEINSRPRLFCMIADVIIAAGVL
jgi:hypothetical protein